MSGETTENACPWCAAPRHTGPSCPRCGVNYAKAEAIKKHGRAPVAASAPASAGVPAAEVGAASGAESAVAQGAYFEAAPQGEWSEVDEPELERKFCLAAIPAALLVAIGIHASGLGASLQRIFLTMPVHELGHAVSAWFCGYTAIPTLWKTIIPDHRGFIAPIALCAALGYGIYRAWQAENRAAIGLGGALLLLQAILTLGIKPDTAQMLSIFGGDGMGMILATLLMASFFFGKRTQLYKGSLRWGFLVIGAAAFVDMYATWVVARWNPEVIPFGTLDGNLTDSSKLVEHYHWKIGTLMNRYFVLGIFCMLGLALVWAWGVRCATREFEARRFAAAAQAQAA